MSALARILLKKGDKVSGSDSSDSQRIQALRAEGAQVFIGQSAENIQSPDAVVYSTSIATDNPEYRQASRKKIPLLHRSQLLAKILEGHTPFLVTGTHGKTSTASLLAHTMIEAGLDPSYALGGYLNETNSNGWFGKGPYFAVEADESDGSFLNYPSFGAIITNLEHDHMEYWKNEEALLEGFKKFAKQVGSKKHLFWCYDDALLKTLDLGGYSYGFSEAADLVIDNFRQLEWKTSFDLSFKRKHYRDIELPLIGAHNVLNAAAVFGMGCNLDIDERTLRKALGNFLGVGRRVERKGSVKDIDIYDDYAHHPTEIFATLRALKNAVHGKRIVLAFQPHRYSRTQYCVDDFADAFTYADEVILTEVYCAGETPLPELQPERIISRIKTGGYNTVRFVERKGLTNYLSGFLQPNDVLITMGAGDITAVGPAVLNQLKA